MILGSFTVTVMAQDQQTDTAGQAIAAMQSLLQNLNKIKISGYLQGQFQVADSTGIKSYAGGDFPAASDKRFSLRRGRLKAMYDNTLTQFVLQIDVTEKGFAIKDVYGKLTDPWLQTFGLTVGVTNRPFGYEIGYSSSMRESPERGRMSQILFPGERDLGAMLTIEPPKTSSFNFFKIEAGLFNGTTGSASDFDKRKDFIGHLILRKSLVRETMKLSGGISYYDGGWRLDTARFFSKVITGDDGVKIFEKDPDPETKGKIMRRNYYGLDFQASYETPVIGMTTIRAEFIGGTHTGLKSSNDSPKELPVDSKTKLQADAYQRNFIGYYLYFLQNIGPLPLQLIVKYDLFDPNTDVKGNDITAVLGAGDIAYTTTGLGLAYRFDSNIRFTAYYDMVTNEKTQLSGYTKDLKDNVFTLRMQYKF